MDYSLPGSSDHGISQARILEWVAISFSRWSSTPRDRTQVSYLACRFFTTAPPRNNKWILKKFFTNYHCSVQFSHSVVPNSLRPHETQHLRPPCPSLIPEVYTNSCPSSQWCHPAVSSSVVPFSSCPQSLPAWVNPSHEMAKVLEFQLQHQSFQWTPRTDLL